MKRVLVIIANDTEGRFFQGKTDGGRFRKGPGTCKNGVCI